jgi:GNAT superfamily N-acetyltransferase
VAEPADAEVIATVLAEAFEGYRAWAPRHWTPPITTATEAARLRGALADPEVWCLLALSEDEVIGHVALSPFTVEDPQRPPVGTTNLWHLFMRPAWQGCGVAAQLMAAAVAEADRRGFMTLRLWTPQGAGRARRFYEREGWKATGNVRQATPFGLPVVQYARAL